MLLFSNIQASNNSQVSSAEASFIFCRAGKRGSLKVSTWSLGRRGILSDFKNVNIFIVLCMQDTHELLTVTYGLPVWASYAIFGVLTVLVGILLGVVSCSLERVRLNTVIDI